MTADTTKAIKKALEGVTHTPGKWEAEGTAVYCDDATGQRVCDTKGDLLFWSEDQKRNAAAYIAATNPVDISELLFTLESLQRENEGLKAWQHGALSCREAEESRIDDYKRELEEALCAQDIATREQTAAFSVAQARAEEAEAEVKRLREAALSTDEPIMWVSPVDLRAWQKMKAGEIWAWSENLEGQCVGLHLSSSAALSSTGDTHGN